MDSGGLFPGCLRRRVAARVWRSAAFRGSAALLAALVAGEAAGQLGGLFREVAPAGAVAGPDLSAVSDWLTLRRHLVAIDFRQLTPSADTAAAVPGGAATAPSGADVEPVRRRVVHGPRPERGADLLGRRTRCGPPRRPTAFGPRERGFTPSAKSICLACPPLGEPIPGRGWEQEELPPLGPDNGFPAPLEARLAPFTDPEILPGVTPVRGAHFTELRTRIDGLRTAGGARPFRLDGPGPDGSDASAAGASLLELRSPLTAAYAAAGAGDPAVDGCDASGVDAADPCRAPDGAAPRCWRWSEGARPRRGRMHSGR